jgi:isoleucyl-tRNA synthetase
MATETRQTSADAADADKKNYKDTLNLPQTDFPMKAELVTNEPKRLAQWQEGRLYEKLIAERKSHGKGLWILHDGPPFANGDIHIGHVINKTLKDVVTRSRSMHGYETPYVHGWDCHGLPIEHKIQEDFKGKLREMSTVEIRRHCFEYASKYARIQAEQFQRLGCLGEWNNPYLTLKPEYEAEVLEVFARFVEAGLVYKQLKPVPWSVANQTALADAELEYKDIEDPSVYVEFPVAPATELASRSGLPVYLLVWTTTPWTLPANLAIAVHPQVRYAQVEYTRAGERRIGVVAEELRAKVFDIAKDATDDRVLDESLTGEELSQRCEYLHPFIEYKGPIVLADYVTTTDGTGLVHTAPGHGEDDYDTGVRHGLQIYSPVLASGRFDDTVPEFIRGKTTKEGNVLITDELRNRNRLFAVQNILHSYPHDWRSKTPILFRATEQWFVSIERPFAVAGETGSPRSLRQRALDACKNDIDFIPAWGSARIGGMLESRPDWCISRQRAWGLPIPVFYNEKGEALLTPKSVRAVAKRFREKGSDCWFTETPTELLGCEQDVCPVHFGEVAKLRKERDIFDVWFESGSSWRTVLQCRTYLNYPAELYLEGSDQHRGWFQLSLLLALGATGRPPFKHVLTHGFAVKPDGTKVSKSDKEYVKAVDEINRHGADLLRLWCCSMDYEGDLPTSPKTLQEFGDKYRKIRNTLRYLLSNLYDFNPATDAQQVPPNSLDGWALHQLDQLIAEVLTAYDTYQFHRAFRALHDFCSVQISAVYGNAMKDRLYCEAATSPLRRRCQTVMHQMVSVLAKLLAPMIVFTADEVWEHIPHKQGADAALASVHLALFPKPSGVAASEEQKAEWDLLLKLRDDATAQLDKLKKEAGVNKALDAEVVYQVDDDVTRRKLQDYGVDLADIAGAGHFTFAEKGAAGPAAVVKVVDRRNDSPACARCWKRRPDVGASQQFRDLCLRCVQATS